MTAWGKAGQRLTPAEIEERRRAAIGERNRRRNTERADLAAAYLRWRHGLIQPATITAALDFHRLEGPEVDLACGAREPDVDRWERGDLYPTWEQLLLLAAPPAAGGTGQPAARPRVPTGGGGRNGRRRPRHHPPPVEQPVIAYLFTDHADPKELGALHDLPVLPAVGDTMSIGEGHYQVCRRHWVVGLGEERPAGYVEIYVQPVKFDGPYGRRPRVAGGRR